MRNGAKVALVVGAAVFAACGGSSSGGSTGGTGSGSCTPTQQSTVTISASGVSPTSVCILPNGSVEFRNTDTASHDIEATSGVACSALNLGPIAASENKSATLPTAGLCTYHDASNASNTAFQGTVAVTTAPVTGPGY